MTDLEKQWIKVIRHPCITDSWIETALFNPDKQDSVWYDEVVVSITFMERFIFTIEAIGEVFMRWNNSDADDEELDDDSASRYEIAEDRAAWLERHGIKNDIDFRACDKIVIENNNWFEWSVWDNMTDEYFTDEWDSIWEADPVFVDPEAIISLIRKHMLKIRKCELENSVQDGLDKD